MVNLPWRNRFSAGMAVMACTHEQDEEMHAHLFVEMVIVLNGEGSHVIKERKKKIRRGDVLLIPPGVAHGYLVSRELKIINVLFEPDAFPHLREELADIPGFHALFTVDTELRKRNSETRGCFLSESNLLEVELRALRLAEELTAFPPGWWAASKSTFLDLLIYLTRNLGNEKRTIDFPFMKVVSAVQYMEAEIGNKLTLQEIAHESGMSSSTLLRSFHKAFGCSPMVYLRGIRLNRVALILRPAKIRSLQLPCGTALMTVPISVIYLQNSMDVVQEHIGKKLKRRRWDDNKTNCYFVLDYNLYVSAYSVSGNMYVFNDR